MYGWRWTALLEWVLQSHLVSKTFHQGRVSPQHPTPLRVRFALAANTLSMFFLSASCSVFRFIEEHGIRVSGRVGVPVRHIRLRHPGTGGEMPQFRYDDRRGSRECSVLS